MPGPMGMHPTDPHRKEVNACKSKSLRHIMTITRKELGSKRQNSSSQLGQWRSEVTASSANGRKDFVHPGRKGSVGIHDGAIGHMVFTLVGRPCLDLLTWGLIGCVVVWYLLVYPLTERKPLSTMKQRVVAHPLGKAVDEMTQFAVIQTITIDCPRCGGSHVIKAGQRNGYQRYQCQTCKKKFRPEELAEGRKYDAELIGATIRDYYMGLSIKQLAESIKDRYGIMEPSKGTIYGWISDYHGQGNLRHPRP